MERCEITHFEGKTCIVTGATSGIGFAIAAKLAEQGADLVIVGRNRARGEDALATLSKGGTRAQLVVADLADRAAAGLIHGRAMEAFDRVDVLINNAGILVRGTVLDGTDDEWNTVLDLNLSSAYRMSRAVLPTMMAQHAGSIVNIASDWALMGAQNATAYCVSKAALAQLTRCMALDFAAHGIRVNAICPGDTATPMLERAIADRGREATMSAINASIPLGRVGRPDEIANATVFLASEAASFMTGALVPVDGGTSAQ
ncbi:NAD(P)-dependent dehydrogenase (short-subunit alcohol dehydrogenase family) [Angulomicrobium tetraedrale]|uniref:NAD(P)-dependent dehydrogenase (Short-subunit alcohol dehydrogenase family) n=1 Tax=Ancylobacter tetraedralis TaxID=217068 RepID=A0A839ZDL0_9HYPH|nr:SDR family NAD(P)-dependent oxidoreductase [Ancylobacter tetraedralis]MBB3772798.1 NAD(P)-dependent dehydrogenase (short-subunit alcohol dehydrogenase family) [Ancylobacter tetraedralis]